MAKVRDPVCNMTIEQKSAAAQGVYGEETVYFCSVACQKTYEKTHPRAG